MMEFDPCRSSARRQSDTLHEPTFSIVVPAFNRAVSILPTLRSVQHQTFSDFEVIVVDDGSLDCLNLQASVESLCDSRFRYVWRPNGGAAAARNTGIDAAKGRFLAFLDSDDIYLPQKLAEDYAVLSGSTANLVLFSQVFVDRGCTRRHLRPSRAPRFGENISEYLACHQGFIQPSTVVMHADFAKHVRFADNIRFFADDTDFALRLSATGAHFQMHKRPMVIMDDSFDPRRLSQKLDCAPIFAWLDTVRPLMSNRAYYSYRGWHGARVAAAMGDRGLALQLYWDALRRGAFPPRLAAKALGQILVRQTHYRSVQRWLTRLTGG